MTFALKDHMFKENNRCIKKIIFKNGQGSMIDISTECLESKKWSITYLGKGMDQGRLQRSDVS